MPVKTNLFLAGLMSAAASMLAVSPSSASEKEPYVLKSVKGNENPEDLPVYERVRSVLDVYQYTGRPVFSDENDKRIFRFIAANAANLAVTHQVSKTKYFQQNICRDALQDLEAGPSEVMAWMKSFKEFEDDLNDEYGRQVTVWFSELSPEGQGQLESFITTEIVASMGYSELDTPKYAFDNHVPVRNNVMRECTSWDNGLSDVGANGVRNVSVQGRGDDR